MRISDSLEKAIKSNDIETIKAEIDGGLDPDIRDYAGNPIIMMCAIQGQNEIVELLIQKGADVNATNKIFEMDESALMFAARKGHTEVVKLLLDNGAKIDHQNRHNQSALYDAVANGHIDTVRCLIGRGADVNIDIYPHTNILTQAVRKGFDDIAKLLIEEGSKIVPGDFMDVVTECNHGTIELFIKNGIDVNIKNYNNSTPLFEAVKKNCLEKVKLLLENGAKINLQDDDGFTPLMYASKQGLEEITEVLIDNGADVNTQNPSLYNQTALEIAKEKKQTATVELLLKHGAQERRFHEFKEDSPIKAFKIIEYFGDEGGDESEEKKYISFVQNEDLAKEYVSSKRDAYENYLKTGKGDESGAFSWGFYYIEYFPFEPKVATSIKEIEEFSNDIYENIDEYVYRVLYK